MKAFLKTYPVHTFLTGIYFIYFIFVNNYHKVTLSMTLRSVFSSFILAALLFGLIYLFLRPARKAGLFTTLLLIGFYMYGYISMLLTDSGAWPFPHLHRVLMGTLVVLFALLFILISRSKKTFTTLNYVTNVLVLALLVVNSFFLVQVAGINPAPEKNPFLAKEVSLNTPSRSDMPDVYYIVLDGYANEETLKNLYGEKDPFLYRSLREQGFYVADSSQANYYDTSPSLACTLNMSYLPGGKEQPVMIRQNLVTHLFKKLGYRIVNMQSGFVVTEKMEFADKTIDVQGPNEFELYILRYTFLMVVDMFRISNYTRLKSQVERLPKVTEEKGPKFGFIHIVSPHPPYIVDENGNKTTRNAVSDSWEPREHYTGQVRYISKVVAGYISELLAAPGKKPVIILQSDHGPWLKDAPRNVYAARAGILNAFYLPEEVKQHLYPAITPVNTFRLLFSQIYQLQLPLLPDVPVPFDSVAASSAFRLYAK